jgi:energy-coupling factor transporter ATP-binding protein EcfA2
MIVYFDMNMKQHTTGAVGDASRFNKAGFYPYVVEKVGQSNHDFVSSSRYDKMLSAAAVRRMEEALAKASDPKSPLGPDLDSDDSPRFEYESQFAIGEGDQFALPTGLTLIIGGSGAGKTTLLRYIAKQYDKHLFIPWGEPEPEASTDAGEFFGFLNAALTLYRDHILLVDSFKSLSHLAGAAMQGGISMNLNLWLTAFSNMIARAGATVVATYNPQGVDDKSDVLFKSLSGSVTAAAKVMDVTMSRKATFTAMSRAADRKSREFKFDTGFVSDVESRFMEHQVDADAQRVAGSLALSQPYGFNDLRVMIDSE